MFITDLMAGTSTELIPPGQSPAAAQSDEQRTEEEVFAKHVMINGGFTINFAVWDMGSEARIWEGYYSPHRTTLDVNNDSSLSQSVT